MRSEEEIIAEYNSLLRGQKQSMHPELFENQINLLKWILEDD